jgi:glycosyltransferase involved in cell wall biosynthesis
MTETGHCYSFVNSLCQSSHGRRLCLWVNRYANISFSGTNIQLKRYFYRRIRRLQCYFLYKKLLVSPGKLFISTAGIIDLVLLNWASSGAVQKNKVYLYFHWFNTSEKKFAIFKRLARKQPNIVILGPTHSVVKVFEEAGFDNAHIVPYPISAQTRMGRDERVDFKGLLYAGAARQDKGISHVVDLVEYMDKLALKIPFKLQNSPNHHGQYDAETKADLQRLAKINYPYLETFPETLNTAEYSNLFVGVICIQLYNPELFADRVSGVTLDALSAGSPIVATAGSWIARMVQRFDAGVVIDSTAPEKILSAIQEIIANYSRYNTNAFAAGLTLRQENSAEFLFNTLTELPS